MIGWFKRVLGRAAEYDDAELAWSERRASSSADAPRPESGDRASMHELRGTVDALRNVGQVQAPRSFALTEENLAAAGYSDQEIARALRPGVRRVPLWHRPVLRQMPLAVTALALLVGGYFVLDDIEVLAPGPSADPALPGSGDAQVQVTVAAESIPVATAQAAAMLADETLAPPQAAATAVIGVTVVVEREVALATRRVEVAAESVPSDEITVEVERAVEATVQLEIAVERVVASEVVEVQREVEVVRQVEIDREAVSPMPELMVTREAQVELDVTVQAELVVATPTSATSGVVATARPAPTTAEYSGSANLTVAVPEPTATAAPIPVRATVIPPPPTELIEPSESPPPRPRDAGPVRIWPSAVALVLALAGVVVWFELRRRRKLWE